MLRGYLSKVQPYADIKEFVNGFQKKMFFKRLREVLFWGTRGHALHSKKV